MYQCRTNKSSSQIIIICSHFDYPNNPIEFLKDKAGEQEGEIAITFKSKDNPIT